MRRNDFTPMTSDAHNRLSSMLVLAAALATLAGFTALATNASAQTKEGRCSEGFMTPNEAGTGTLLLKTATPGCYLAAPSVASGIDIDIAGPIARTTITQRFENPADGWVEGIYVFPLPETAAVDTLKMTIGTRLIEGEIKERQEARRIYETARAEGRTASLVEQIRPNVFNNNVANIGPFETIIVQIEYQENLRFDLGAYHLRVPLVVAPRYSPARLLNLVRREEGGWGANILDPVPDRERLNGPVLRPEYGKINPVSLTIQLESGFPLGAVESGSHDILVVRNGMAGASIALREGEVPADRDFTLTFSPVAGQTPAFSLLKEHWGGEDYLLALVVPPAAASTVRPRPRETIFVLDSSGSMGGESIRQARAGLLLALDRLTPDDRFNVIEFNSTTTALFPAPVDATPENLAYAKGFVANIEARGGTEMLPALLQSLEDAAPEDQTRLRQVIFLTDGAVGNEAQLFAAIDQQLGRSRLFTVGIGSAPNAHFMNGAARAGRGTYTFIGSIDEVSVRMAELFTKLENPVMTDISVQLPGGLTTEIWPNPLPDLYATEPVVLTMKAETAEGVLVLSGNLGDVPWRQEIDLNDARPATGIEKIWARNKIAAFEESRVLGVQPAAIDRAVLDVALAHHLTSRLTSLVAVDITPRRPDDAPLATRDVPLNLPEGWDFDKVFGKTVTPGEQHTQNLVPDTLIANLVLGDAPAAASEPQDAGLILPQGGTGARLALIVGIAVLLIGTVLLLCEGRSRRVIAG